MRAWIIKYSFVLLSTFLSFSSPVYSACDFNNLPLDEVLDLVDESLETKEKQKLCQGKLCETEITFNILKSEVSVNILNKENSATIREDAFTLKNQSTNWLCLNSLSKSPEFFLSISANTTLEHVISALTQIDILSGNIAYKQAADPLEYFTITPGKVQIFSKETKQQVFERLSEMRIIKNAEVVSPKTQKPEATPDTETKVNDKPIEFKGGPLKLSKLESVKLAQAIKKCWITYPSGKVDDLKLTISVAFDKQGRALPDGIDFSLPEETVNEGDRSDILPIFNSARRAVLRCGRNGFEQLRGRSQSYINITFTPSISKITVGNHQSEILDTSEPLPIAVPVFITENIDALDYATELTDLIVQDLTSSGLFRVIPQRAHISKLTDFSAPVQFSDWKAINSQALVSGAVKLQSGGQINVKFRVFDVSSEREMGTGLQFTSRGDGWRRIAHKVADTIYSRISGESGYFDSRVVFVSESGRKDNRKTRLAVMDQDGANVQYLTDSSEPVSTPRFSPDGSRIAYTSFASGYPRIHLMDVGTARSRVIVSAEKTMSFSPRFSPDGKTVAYSEQIRPLLTFLGARKTSREYKTLVQKLLNEKNCDAGAEDGVIGVRTQRAVEKLGQASGKKFSDGIYSKNFFDELFGGSIGCDEKPADSYMLPKSKDIYLLSLSSGKARRLTNTPFADAEPSFSPDGKAIVFQSDRSGSMQLYTMSLNGSGVKRISFGSGQYFEPVWSPKGDMIAFKKRAGKRFHIGIVDPDGSNEKLLTASYLDRAPSWAPNGRVIIFTRETEGANGTSSLYSVNVSGRNLKSIITPNGASDPSWSPLGG